jgi:hypothetical protein
MKTESLTGRGGSAAPRRTFARSGGGRPLGPPHPACFRNSSPRACGAPECMKMAWPCRSRLLDGIVRRRESASFTMESELIVSGRPDARSDRPCPLYSRNGALQTFFAVEDGPSHSQIRSGR